MPARIVVVHDEHTLREPLATSLRAVGYDVVTFHDSLAAWGALNAAAKIEILVTRVQFDPGKPHGIALANAARSKCPGLRVLFVARPEFKEYAEESGMFLSLPASVPEIAEAVGRMLANEKLGSVSV